MNSIKNKIGLIGIIIASLTMSACNNKETAPLAKDTRPTVAVKVAQAGGSTQKGYFTVSGKIQAENNIQVSSRLMGELMDIHLKVGDKVSAGQTLAKINDTDIRAKIAQADAGILQAQTAYNNIEKDYARIKTLFEKQSATQKELDDISSNKNIMQAKLKQAEEVKNEINALLSYSTIKAPFAGTITEKYVNSGDLASPGKPLFGLASSKSFQAEAMIPEYFISEIHKGDKVKIILKSHNKEMNGVIAEQSQSSLTTGGQYLVKININKTDLAGLQLFSGMYVNVLIPEKETSNMPNTVLVNKSAIVSKGQLTGLYTVSEQNTAILRWVRLGKDYGKEVEIISGLSVGESYISEHDGRLLNGVKVVLN